MTHSHRPDLDEILKQAQRVPNSTGWFEILRLPNDVYAFWEPGHEEEVNAFLILGSKCDVLYDTGMGIASIGRALEDLRREEGLPDRELMVVNSHNHLDHNGGNTDFDEAWIIEDPWAISKLTEGIEAGGMFVEYWGALRSHPGVKAPEGFDPATFHIPPFPRNEIRFLADGDIVDLGNRRFRVIHTISHSPDGLALYDDENAILFGGDTFVGDEFLIRDLALLERDLEIVSKLQVEWHYCSHGPQLIEVMRSGFHLSIVRRMRDGERTEGETSFAGLTFPLYELEGVGIILAPEFLTY
jgi:glyoxylase-like metal-dependent hydrolase (beta-lactamase superfamily II)